MICNSQSLFITKTQFIMKKKIKLGKKLSISKEKLSKLTEAQMAHLMGGRMAFGTGYTSGEGTCSINSSSCCG